MILQGADGHHPQGNDPNNRSHQHRDAGRYGGQQRYNKVGSGQAHQPSLHRGHHGPGGHGIYPGPHPIPHPRSAFSAPRPTGPYIDVFGYNNFGPFFPSATQVANNGNDHFWPKQAVGQLLPGNPYLSVRDESYYSPRDVNGDSFHRGALEHIEPGIRALTLDYCKTNIIGQTVGASSFPPGNLALPSVTQSSVLTALSGSCRSLNSNSLDASKRLNSVNITSGDAGQSSIKSSWASVASQTAKSQLKPFKSKICSPIFSGKHMLPPTPSISINYTGTWKNENGAVKSIPGPGTVGLGSTTSHIQTFSSGRHSNSSSTFNAAGINHYNGQSANAVIPNNVSASWGLQKGVRNLTRSANLTHSEAGFISSSNSNSSTSIHQGPGQHFHNFLTNHHIEAGAGSVVRGTVQSIHKSQRVNQIYQGNDGGSSNSAGAVHHHHDNDKQLQHNQAVPISRQTSSSHHYIGSNSDGSQHQHLGGHGSLNKTNHRNYSRGSQNQNNENNNTSTNVELQKSISIHTGPAKNDSNLPIDGTDYPSHPILDKLRVENNYNPKEFDLSPKDARFFIIKSYAEDDIHRSIKYGIWCSTAHGNERLDIAFKSQQGKGPLYLFYSVNGSGHFCGMAQMLSMVDYNSTSNVWAQDKWKGQFKVKWIYVKDVPNAQLRHIRLENNENKPVTNSRDTQEVPYSQGKAVLKIMHNYHHTTSIFDDFLHYEKRQEEEYQRRVATETSPLP